MSASTLQPMEVELHTTKGVVGRLTLVGDKVVADTHVGQAILDKNTVVEPDTLIKLTPDKGARYLAALPANLDGSYFWAEVKGG